MCTLMCHSLQQQPCPVEPHDVSHMVVWDSARVEPERVCPASGCGGHVVIEVRWGAL